MKPSLTLLLEDLLDLRSTLGETLNDAFDIVALLHGDNAHLVLLVDPDEQVLVVIVEDTTGIGPVTSHTTRQQKS